MQGSESTPKAPLGNNARPVQNLHHRTVRTNIDFKKTKVSLSFQAPRVSLVFSDCMESHIAFFVWRQGSRRLPHHVQGYVLPSESLVIGHGHVNSLTSRQNVAGSSFANGTSNEATELCLQSCNFSFVWAQDVEKDEKQEKETIITQLRFASAPILTTYDISAKE